VGIRGEVNAKPGAVWGEVGDSRGGGGQLSSRTVRIEGGGRGILHLCKLSWVGGEGLGKALDVGFVTSQLGSLESLNLCKSSFTVENSVGVSCVCVRERERERERERGGRLERGGITE
jgi:hypothetical protein